MKNILLTINGKKVTCPPGTSILDAAKSHSIRIPTLCAHAQLAPYGACRICLVEEENTGRLMASCVTPAAPDMTIHTDSPRVIENRKNIVRLMMAEHPESCIVCSKGNRCELRMIAAQLGVAETRLYPMPNHKPFETLNPFISRDLSKCILCGKCIRADHELVCIGAIDYSDRGFSSRPATLHGLPLEMSRCTFCGTCVSMCPTGALSTCSTVFTGTPDKEEATICGFCSAGCSLSMGISGTRVVEVNPAAETGTVNGATLCVRGHFAHDFLMCADRLDQPYMRHPDEQGDAALQPVHLDAALSAVVARLTDIKDENGPESIAFMGSAKCTNEENYLFQKIARAIFGTNNITTLGSTGTPALLRKTVEKAGSAIRVSPLPALENADAVITVLADPDHSVPVAGYHLKRGVRKGAKLIVIDPLRSILAAFGGLWLHPENRRGSPAFAFDTLNAIAAQMVRDGSLEHGLATGRVEDPHGWTNAMAAADPEALAAKAGVFPEKIKKAANLLSARKIAFVVSGDLLETPYGHETLDAVINLALATGSIGAKNAGIFILSTENNAAGALDMGCAPDMLPGWRKISDTKEKRAIAEIWGANIPEMNGKDIHGIIAAAEAGTLKALYIMGENPLRALPDPERIRVALKKLDFIVVQDIVKNRTTDIAHVVLPGASFAEKQGSFTNMEGRIQHFSAAAPPPGDALPDWAILAMLAQKAGYPDPYATIEDIRREIRRVVPMYSDLGSRSAAWVKPGKSENPEKAILSFAAAPDTVGADEHYPFTAHIVNRRWHLGSGTRTARSARIQASGKKGHVEMAPGDAKALGLDGSGNGLKMLVRLLSPFGAIERPVDVNPAVPEGSVYVPQGFSGNDAMQLADFNAVKPPGSGWRTVPVRIETVSA